MNIVDMNETDAANLRAMLTRHEGRLYQVYDDATGKPLHPGDTLVGWPTIGVGRNLLNPGLHPLEVDYLLDNDIHERLLVLTDKLSWFHTLDEVRQAAFVDMSFMGVQKLLGFHNMLAACAVKAWATAAAEALDSAWAKQVGKRAQEIAAMLETGEWQT
jgi:hypothetical protein